MDYSNKDKDFFIEKFYGYTGNDTITGGTGSDISGSVVAGGPAALGDSQATDA